MDEEAGVGVSPRGEDLVLVAAVFVETGDLAAGEAPTAGVVGDADLAVREQVVPVHLGSSPCSSATPTRSLGMRPHQSGNEVEKDHLRSWPCV